MAAGDSLTSYALLLLLALQYGLQPFLTASFLSAAGCDARAVVLATELAKAALCAVSLVVQRQPGQRFRGSTLADLRRAAAPAACYLVQNLLLQRAYADLDSLTFNCLNQTKLVATTLALYVLLRQRQTPRQLLALAMLLLAGALLQLTGERAAARGAAAAVGDFRRGMVVRRVFCGRASWALAAAALCFVRTPA
jgi:UDP-sugar transporter A1/2/3